MGGILGIIVLVLDILAVLNVIKSGKSGGQKVLWIALIVLLPFVGLIAYYLIGKKS